MDNDKTVKVNISGENAQFEAFRRKYLQDQSRNKQLIKVTPKKRGDGFTDFDIDIEELMKLHRPLLEKKQIFRANQSNEPKKPIHGFFKFKYDFPLFLGSERDLSKNQLMKILFDCWAAMRDNSLNVVLNGLNFWHLNLPKSDFDISTTEDGHAMAQTYGGNVIGFDFVPLSDAKKKTIATPLLLKLEISCTSPDSCRRIENNGYFYVTGEAETDLYEDVRINSISDFEVRSLCYVDFYGFNATTHTGGQVLL